MLILAAYLVGAPGVEPGFDRYERPVLAVERYARMERTTGFEPATISLATRDSSP